MVSVLPGLLQQENQWFPYRLAYSSKEIDDLFTAEPPPGQRCQRSMDED